MSSSRPRDHHDDDDLHRALAAVAQGQICSDSRTCCHTERRCRSNLSHTQSQCTDTGPTSPRDYNAGREATGVLVLKSPI